MKLYYIVNVMMDFSSVILKKVIFAKMNKGFTYIFRFFLFLTSCYLILISFLQLFANTVCSNAFSCK